MLLVPQRRRCISARVVRMNAVISLSALAWELAVCVLPMTVVVPDSSLPSATQRAALSAADAQRVAAE